MINKCEMYTLINMTQNDPINIKVELSDPLSENFQKIKQHYGLKKNSALMRLIIQNEFKRIFGNHLNLPQLEEAPTLE